ASVAAENEDAEAYIVHGTQTASVTLKLPGATEATTASIANAMSLPGYDGTADFAGVSGSIVQGWTQMPTTAAQLSDVSDLAAFTGTGTLDVPILTGSTASLDGPGNLLARLLAEAGATATVSYTY